MHKTDPWNTVYYQYLSICSSFSDGWSLCQTHYFSRVLRSLQPSRFDYFAFFFQNWLIQMFFGRTSICGLNVNKTCKEVKTHSVHQQSNVSLCCRVSPHSAASFFLLLFHCHSLLFVLSIHVLSDCEDQSGLSQEIELWLSQSQRHWRGLGNQNYLWSVLRPLPQCILYITMLQFLALTAVVLDVVKL